MGGATYNCKIIDHLHTLLINNNYNRTLTILTNDSHSIQPQSKSLVQNTKKKDIMDGKLQDSLSREQHVSTCLENERAIGGVLNGAKIGGVFNGRENGRGLDKGAV